VEVGFNEGSGANLAGQVIAGSVTIDPIFLTQICGSGGACYGDFGAGAISVSFSLNGITASVVSTGTLGYFGGRSGGSVSVSDPTDGGSNYLTIGATSPDGMVQECIGALFNNATLFSAYGGGDPAAAIASLGHIGGGGGSVKGGITFMSPVEHIDATILGIDIPEPASLALFGVALAGLGSAKRRMAHR
jgi:PEP-CTERM motif